MTTLDINDLKLVEYIQESTKLIAEMQKCVDEITEQVCGKVIQQGTMQELTELYGMLPDGFYRSNIREFLDRASKIERLKGWEDT